MIDTLIFIGMAGVGKTTIGSIVAKKCNLQHIDIDKEISRIYNTPINKLIQKIGSSKFQQLESSLVKKNIKKNKIISPGGSFIYSQDTIKKLAPNVIFIYLFDSYTNIKNRIPNIETRGIIGLENKSFKDIYNEREPLYAKTADFKFDLSTQSFDECTQNIIQTIELIKRKN